VAPDAVDGALRSARRYGGLSGLAFVALFGIGNALWAFDAPSPGAPPAEIVAFYDDTASEIVVGASLSLLSVAAFGLFAASVRTALAGRDEALANASFGGALLGLSAGIGAESINMVGALRAESGDLSPDLAQSVFEISQALGTTAASVGIAIFGIAAALACLRTGRMLSRRESVFVLAIGLSLLTPAARIIVWPGAAMMLLAATISVALLRAERRASQPAS